MRTVDRLKGKGLGAWILVLLAAFVACNTPSASIDSETKLRVTTTISPITSIVENIGGVEIRTVGIVPEGVNSHTFSPSPSLARTLANTDLFVLNGLFLEEPSLELARANLRPEARILALGDEAIGESEWKFDFSFPKQKGRPNPHLWPNPKMAFKYAELIKATLSELDPENAGYFATNLQAFHERVLDLDRRILASVATIPPLHRKLLTYHDSWVYFADHYNFEVVGALQPSNFSEPSSREVAGLIDQIRALELPAIFGSEVFHSSVLEEVARESGAVYVDALRDDDLPGSPGDPRHSYLGLMLENAETIIEALGGNTSALQAFNPSLVFEGTSLAVYPQ